MKSLTKEEKIFQILRIACAMCFIGHGAFGIITKPIWCNYFNVFGIGHDMSYRLMPIVGSIDIAFGLILLISPIPAVAVWLVIWGLFTASLRPLSGEPFAEFIERAGNFGAPLALLIMTGGREAIKDWFKPFIINKWNNTIHHSLFNYLKITVFLLLLGHGWLNLIEKKSLITQYDHLGFNNPATIAQMIGMFEIIAAFTILIRPIKILIISLFIWKISTELFYPHYELFEFIERGGSYGALLALWITIDKEKSWIKMHSLKWHKFVH